MKILNFILNQLGFIFIVLFVILFYKDIIKFSWINVSVALIILSAVFLASETVYKKISKKIARN